MVSKDTTYLKKLLTAGGMWYKMDRAEGIMSAEKAKAEAGEKTDVRTIAAASGRGIAKDWASWGQRGACRVTR